jgi:hypothetical protein
MSFEILASTPGLQSHTSTLSTLVHICLNCARHELRVAEAVEVLEGDEFVGERYGNVNSHALKGGVNTPGVERAGSLNTTIITTSSQCHSHALHLAYLIAKHRIKV